MAVDDNDHLDLTPRGAGVPPALRRRPVGARRWFGAAVLVAVVGMGSFVVVRALDDATLFFRNADEAVAQRAELGTDRFRLQGLVVPGSVSAYPGGVEFQVAYNGVTVDVEHTGDPVELFDDDIPVVLEGSWSGVGANAVFVSDRMLVKHDENYVADNAGRLDDAGTGGNAAASGPTVGP